MKNIQEMTTEELQEFASLVVKTFNDEFEMQKPITIFEMAQGLEESEEDYKKRVLDSIH